MTRKTSMTERLLPLALLAIVFLAIGCKSKAVDDATLTNNVHAALTGDSAISSEPVQVSVAQGVTTLSGNVSSDTARLVAAQDAAKVSGVKEVVNNLSIAGVAVPPTITSSASPAEPRPATAQEAQIISSNGTLPPPSDSAPPPPAPPVYQDLTVPAGTGISVRINQGMSSATAQVGQTFSGVVTHSIIVNGEVAIPAGSGVSGRVVVADDAGHYSGNSRLSVELTGINRHGDHIAVSSDAYALVGKGRGKNTAEKIGGGAAIGAVLGGILGHGKGALIGAAAGGGGGAVVNGVTKGQEVEIPSESVVRFHLTNTFNVRSEGPAGQAESNEGLQQREQ